MYVSVATENDRFEELELPRGISDLNEFQNLTTPVFSQFSVYHGSVHDHNADARERAVKRIGPLPFPKKYTDLNQELIHNLKKKPTKIIRIPSLSSQL